MISWRFCITFCTFLTIIWGIRAQFGPSFPKVPLCPKYPKTGKTLPSDGFCTWVRLQLIQNLEFNNLHEFLYTQAHDLEYLGPISWTCSSAQNTLKQRYKSTLRWSLYLMRFHLMWSLKFNFLDDFLCISVHD